MRNVLAMVLAGGRGMRMDILCHDRPKPVLPFGGGVRVVDFSLSNCVHSQVDHVAILADYQRSHLAEYLGRWNSNNAVKGGFHVLEPAVGSYRGTADAVYQNLGYLHRLKPDKVLVLAGDHVYKMDYRKMLTFHEQVKADVTVGVVQVPIEEAHRFGTVTENAAGRITDFVEKSSTPVSSLVSMGMYVFNTGVLARRLTEDAAEASSTHDFGYAVIPGMVKKDLVYAFKFDGYWQDIGTVEAYYWANMELIRERPPFSLDGGWPILTGDSGPLSAEPSRQGNVWNSVVSPGCVIKGRVENSVLSAGVRVEEKAVIMNSVIMANAFIGSHSIVDHCLLDEAVNVGKLCYLGFRGGLVSDSPAITVLGKGARVPAHTAIGRNCKVLPQVDQADFIASSVPSGAVVARRNASSAPVADEKVVA